MIELVSGVQLEARMTHAAAKKLRDAVAEAWEQPHPMGSVMLLAGAVVRIAAIATVEIRKLPREEWQTQRR